MLLLQLFWSFFQIGVFSIGGGYAAMPLIQSQVVQLHGWLSVTEFADIVTIAEMTPGPIAINSATFVGTKVAGIPGALVATAGCIVPSCIIVMTIAYFYFKYQNVSVIQGVLGGLRPAVVSLIASAGLSILLLALFNNPATTLLTLNLRDTNVLGVVLFVASLVVLRKCKKINPLFVMAGSGLIGMVLFNVL
nr:chromate transporter [Maliibacterium massiliense]